MSNVEPEHKGPFWKHPYFVYIAITVALFLGLIVFAYVALKSGFVPERTI